jgi:TetR/AcrR family tetracycline transcriptional repressor
MPGQRDLNAVKDALNAVKLSSPMLLFPSPVNLDRQTVVRTALRVLDRTGLDGLTVRKIAAELRVQAPALYWHFKNKQELLDEMATTVLADSVREQGTPRADLPWQEWAAESARGLRRTLLRYRDGARMFSGRYLTDSSLYAPMEASLAKFTSSGFSLSDAASILGTLYCYVIGFTIEEQGIFPRKGQRSKRYDPAKRAKRIDQEKFPLSIAVGPESFTQFEESFNRGVELILRGAHPQN